MNQIPDDPMIREIERTGYPAWAQEMIEDFPAAEPEEIPEYCLQVLDAIPVGKRHAISRSRLAEKTGMTDRTVRRAIEILRRDYIILNDQDGQGYYLSWDQDRIERAYRQERARALSILRRMKPMRQMLREGGRL